jgi:hypothetical protein
VTDPDGITPESLAPLLAEAGEANLLLLASIG